jgi:Cu/Ag efflux protein CusF
MSRHFSVLAVLALVFVLGLTTTALAEDIARGKIKTVTADKNEFVLTDSNGKDWNMQMGTTGKVRLNDKDSRLNELKAGDTVEVTYEKQGEKLICKEIRAKRE